VSDLVDRIKKIESQSPTTIIGIQKKEAEDAEAERLRKENLKPLVQAMKPDLAEYKR